MPTPDFAGARSHHARFASSSGLTLIETLIVIVILGILSGIAVFAVGSLTSSSAQGSCSTDYKNVQVAVTDFKTQEGIYPTAGSNGVSGSDAVPALLTVDITVTPNAGPWLKDPPISTGRYRIEVSTTGNGAITVFNAAGTMQLPAVGTNPPGVCADVTG